MKNYLSIEILNQKREVGFVIHYLRDMQDFWTTVKFNIRIKMPTQITLRTIKRNCILCSQFFHIIFILFNLQENFFVMFSRQFVLDCNIGSILLLISHYYTIYHKERSKFAIVLHCRTGQIYRWKREQQNEYPNRQDYDFFSPFCRLDFLCNELFNAIDMLLVVKDWTVGWFRLSCC